ncbi:hypothetical protein [Terrabacter sp. Root181]|uniref:hypothetical protein n=1 Tax=Terrabacter sp. Root181 TaxID=1736484 RepID=UPI0012FB8D5A|nr:hypothetical protein [Terrabacter sp. Root181]
MRSLVGYTRAGTPVFPIFGAMPRGYNSAGDVVKKLADGTDTANLFTEFDKAAAAQNAKRDGFAAALSFRTVNAYDDVLQGTSDFVFEDTTEYGEPVGYRALPTALPVAYTFKFRDIAVRTTWRFLIDATAEQVRSNTNGVLEADNRQVFEGIMGSFFDPAQRVSPEGNPVYGLYNADGTVPPAVDGTTFLGTHTHYLTSGAANFDGADLNTLMGHVTHHGYGTNGSGQLLVFAHPDDVEIIRGFKVASGSPADFIPSAAAPAYLTADTIMGQVAPATYGALPVAGSFGSAWVLPESLMPKGYLLAVASGGPNSPDNPVGFREHVRADLKGLRQVGGPDNRYPLQDSFWARGFGTGIRHRGAAAVMQVTANASYAAPSKYVRTF